MHGWYDLPGLNGAPCLLKKKERERRATYKWTAKQSANDQNAPPGHKKLSHLHQKVKTNACVFPTAQGVREIRELAPTKPVKNSRVLTASAAT